jgi:SAM-dependent methyltransferase
MIADESYDFVLASHMLEHTANPLATLAEWRRVLKPGGGLVLVLPHRDGTFDHRRSVTTLGHLLRDMERNVAEDDSTHFEEVLRLHDLSLDAGVANVAAFRARVERNSEIRSVHHHVFDTRLAIAILERSRLEVEAVEPLEPHHIIVVGRKSGGSSLPPGVTKLELERTLRKSPFPTDRK